MHHAGFCGGVAVSHHGIAQVRNTNHKFQLASRYNPKRARGDLRLCTSSWPSRTAVGRSSWRRWVHLYSSSVNSGMLQCFVVNNALLPVGRLQSDCRLTWLRFFFQSPMWPLKHKHTAPIQMNVRAAGRLKKELVCTFLCRRLVMFSLSLMWLVLVSSTSRKLQFSSRSWLYYTCGAIWLRFRVYIDVVFTY